MLILFVCLFQVNNQNQNINAPNIKLWVNFIFTYIFFFYWRVILVWKNTISAKFNSENMQVAI